jgi:hypothetical protein
MSISSVSSSPSVQPPAQIVTKPLQPTPSDVNNNNDDSNDAGAAQIVTAAPLPPGQGTRIDQLA